ncbi:MAG: tRNA epoxyqueuosine(34) reductase QueG [Chitinophagaceae bacterium]
MNVKSSYTRFIKDTASALGFDQCGIAPAAKLTEEAKRLENWLKNGYQGTMAYMENHFELRIDPTRLVPGARSVITLLKNYFTESKQQPEAPRISKYAFGKDYHVVIKKQLSQFLERIREETREFNGRGFVDSAPVLERSWAQRSGLGWVGKNGNLISRGSGSFFFIATLITDLELEYDDPFARDYCGTCTRCIDACPTDAILPDKVVDGSRCISYFTIELKDQLIPEAMKNRSDDWIFGCDICQDVCPWNRFSKPHREPGFKPIPEIMDLSTKEWEEMSEEAFHKIFRESPLKRAKYNGIRRNLDFIRDDN